MIPVCKRCGNPLYSTGTSTAVCTCGSRSYFIESTTPEFTPPKGPDTSIKGDDIDLILDTKVEVPEYNGTEEFNLSAQVSYLERLVKEYEKIIPLEKQKEIKRFIFSEDDR